MLNQSQKFLAKQMVMQRFHLASAACIGSRGLMRAQSNSAQHLRYATKTTSFPCRGFSYNHSSYDRDTSSSETSSFHAQSHAPYAIEVNAHQTDKLLMRQKTYEQNPMDYEAAFEYFRELNRQNKYLTVIRLYQRAELKFSEKNVGQYKEKIRDQYWYAYENMLYLEKALNESGSWQGGPGGDQEKWFDILAPYLKKYVWWGLTMAITAGLFYFILGQNGMGEMNKFEIKKAEHITQKLDDVKGIDEIKEEILNIIKIIKSPQLYQDKGAKLFKGVMLTGEPGTGKTLLARAIAGEAGCNFIFCSGSDFDEMFVGVGARRVKQLFAEARKNQPCIIFIDEIDSLLSGQRRGKGESSSSRATLNQILAEMDGFEQNNGIMVIGATNHEGALDPAAVRPGRFDKKIHVPHPDINGREDIFKLYLDKIKKSDNVVPKLLAQMSPGFTGAEIENLVNTAITMAVQKDKEEADNEDFECARDRIMMGIERKKLSMSEKDRLNTAIHESGHALACYFNEHALKLYKATIVARGGALGVTFMVPDESQTGMNKAQILAQIDVAMGGHVAEKLIIGNDKISSGCSSDLQGATKYAVQAVRQSGMFGDVNYSVNNHDNSSEEQNAKVDRAVKKILDESFERVKNLLMTKDKELRRLSKVLYEQDYLDADDMDRIIRGEGIAKEKEEKKVRSWDEEKYGPPIVQFKEQYYR